MDALRPQHPAPSADRTTVVSGAEIPIGILPINVPTYQDNDSWLASVDYTGERVRFRYIRNASVAVDPGAVPNLPTFTSEIPARLESRYPSGAQYRRRRVPREQH